MPSRFARSLTLGTLGLLLVSGSTQALAQTDAPSTIGDARTEHPPNARNRVIIGVSGALDAEARTTLLRLLRAELEPQGLEVVERDPSGDARTWAREAANDDRHLLAALLDTNGEKGWRLVLIDAARGRAISRDLPRGERDAANVEAVVSIVVSATGALREGLEVASAPLESVVEAERPKPEPPPPEPKSAPPREPESSAGTNLHASASALVGSFAEEAEPTFGVSVGLGASVGAWLDVDVRGARHFPVDVESPFGTFTLARTGLELGAGPVLRDGAFSFVPSLGACLEWITRSDTLAAEGVAPEDDAGTTSRFGGVLAMRGRYRLLSAGDAERLSLVGGLGAGYFGKRVRFLAGDTVIVDVRKPAIGAELGLFFATDSL